ncbi:hypothetical protein [Streptomyces oceani]|uniref:hypothetical protein n=1 Tax=Streptomyces oceani TaxID=1075402 RepID=UPI0009A0F5E6|nr:hypothetical protein [Streptomyces oceani]
MGWTVLYIAFGVVALWLLGEVLLQYKARLRWRLLAFAGFATVVVGVALLSSIPVIALGAMAFAVGQTFVTLSYRRGFSTGWALGGKPGSSRRRRDGMAPMEPLDADPALEVSGLEAHDPASSTGPPPAGPPTVGFSAIGSTENSGDHAAVPPDPSGQPGYPPDLAGPPGYPPGSEDAQLDPAGAVPGFLGYPGNDEQHQFAGYPDPYHAPAADPAATASFEAYAATGADGTGGGDFWQPGSYPPSPYGQGPYEPGGGDYPQPEFPAGPPPFAPPGQPSDGYGTVFAADGQPFPHPADHDPYAANAYASGYPESSYTQTPPGGVWVPQQRDTDTAGGAVPFQPPTPEGYPGYGQQGYPEPGYAPGDSAGGHVMDDHQGYPGYGGYGGYQPVTGEYDAAGYPVPTGQGGYDGYGPGFDPAPNGYPYDEQRGW